VGGFVSDPCPPRQGLAPPLPICNGTAVAIFPIESYGRNTGHLLLPFGRGDGLVCRWLAYHFPDLGGSRTQCGRFGGNDLFSLSVALGTGFPPFSSPLSSLKQAEAEGSLSAAEIGLFTSLTISYSARGFYVHFSSPCSATSGHPLYPLRQTNGRKCFTRMRESRAALFLSQMLHTTFPLPRSGKPFFVFPAGSRDDFFPPPSPGRHGRSRIYPLLFRSLRNEAPRPPPPLLPAPAGSLPPAIAKANLPFSLLRKSPYSRYWPFFGQNCPLFLSYPMSIE